MLLDKIIWRIQAASRREDWSHWYRKNHNPAERVFRKYAPLLGSTIKGVLDLGCAAGRNLVPFEGIDHYGVDIAPHSKIEFETHLTYFQSSLAEFEFPGRMDDILCISHGAILYLRPRQQRQLLAKFAAQGCRNFILQEYDLATLYRGGYSLPYDVATRFLKGNHKVGYPFSNPKEFEKRWFRDDIPAWIKLFHEP